MQLVTLCTPEKYLENWRVSIYRNKYTEQIYTRYNFINNQQNKITGIVFYYAENSEFVYHVSQNMPSRYWCALHKTIYSYIKDDNNKYYTTTIFIKR